jgi:glycosyltransferase involved in cell wall biosynthesis
VLFLSRIAPAKGLLNLINAWKQVCAEGWRLQIAGPNEDGHLAEVLARVKQADVGDSVEYIGVMDGEAKRQLYLCADIFVLPTFTENFGVVVAEALAHGLPVITTRGAPWADLETFDCGWWVDIGVGPLVLALREAMALSDDERCAMGARGRVYAQRYDWGGIAHQMVDVYRWVLGQGPQPSCVRKD